MIILYIQPNQPPELFSIRMLNYGGTASPVIAKGNYSSLPGGVPNDWMSSLKVPSGWTVEVYADGGFAGTKWTFTADTPWVGSDCNDKMSSVKIY